MYQCVNLDHGCLTLSKGCHDAPFVVVLKPLNAAPVLLSLFLLCRSHQRWRSSHVHSRLGQLTPQECILDRAMKKDN